VPWNKGLTKKDNSKLASSKKILFSCEQKEEIKKLYLEGLSTSEIGKKFGCSSHPIADFLDEIKIRRNISEARVREAAKKLKRIYEYTYQGVRLKVIDGHLNLSTNQITTCSKLELTCIDCKKVFIRTFNGYRSSLCYNDNDVVCRKCARKRSSLKYDRNVKTSSQQKNICDMLGATLNHKIGASHVDMALIEDKIIIEYDGWTWHGSEKAQKRDRRRDEYFKGKGWKILRIKGRRKTPPQQEIEEQINVLRTSDKLYVEIVLDDWGNGEVF
jgi:very-short-patch-repair endonuclease